MINAMMKKITNVILATAVAACIGCSAERLVWSFTDEEAGVVVSIDKQEVELVRDGAVVKRYRCSTAEAGVGSLRDSGRTPLGWHRVAVKIGDGLPVGAVLKDRQWTGEVWMAGMGTDEDLILSRILWLEGMEEGKNRGGDVDSRQRYIYIHGTNRVDELGRPASGGCIRMDPAEVIELYEAVEDGCLVLITTD